MNKTLRSCAALLLAVIAAGTVQAIDYYYPSPNSAYSPAPQYSRAPTPPRADPAMQRAQDATVMVCVEYGEQPNAEISWGSGMIIGSGLVVTNAHVVNEKVPTRIYIQNAVLPQTPVRVVARRYDANEFTPTHVVDYLAASLIDKAGIKGVRLSRQQSTYDMAVLAFTPPPGVNLPALAFNQEIRRGDAITAVGYPGREATQFPTSQSNYYGYTPGTVAPIILTSGSVDNVGDRAPQIIVHNAQCSTGNSGGPIVNQRGEIVGMQTWTSVPGQTRYMSLAIGSRDIVNFLREHGIPARTTGQPKPESAPEPVVDVRSQVLDHAERGDADFQALAGFLYYLGDCGFPKDERSAAFQLQRAVNGSPYDRNIHLFQAGLAAVLSQSPSLWNPDYAESLLVAANNAPNPDPHIQAYEAALRTQGKAFGIRPDARRSLDLANKAIEGSFAFPFAIAGYHYYFGDTPAGKDHAKALRFAREAANNDIVEGISLLAHLYYDSDVIPRNQANKAVARRLARDAAAQGDPWAFGLLANIYYDSDSPSEKVAALKLALLGACHGNRLSFLCLGRMAWDAFGKNTADLGQASRAWAYINLAEQQGVVPLLQNDLNRGRPIRSSQGLLAYLSPQDQHRVLTDAKSEQEAFMAKREYRPRVPELESLASALALP